MRSVIFDLDGTLIDSAPDIHAAINRMLDEIGEEGLSDTDVRGFIGNGVAVLVERVMVARSLPIDRHRALLDIFMRHYNANPAELTTLYPNALNVLDGFRDRGMRMGVCTNKPEGPTRDILAAFELSRLFDVVVGGDTLPVRKPDPAPLHRAADVVGRDATVYVGDSEVDSETARSARLPFALFTEGYRKLPVEDLPHDAHFSDYAELPAIIDKLAPLPG
ncbi:MAG: phosphoglycolate phosphatase [Paracoccaceae bacterium]